MKILIIDDEKIILDKLHLYLSRILSHTDKIFLAANAYSGLELIKRENPDIVLTDIRMPQKNGLEIASYMHKFHPDKITILITGYSDFEYAQKGIKYHVFDYILKPIDEQILKECVTRAIRNLNSKEDHKTMKKIYTEYLKNHLPALRKNFFENLLFKAYPLDSSDLKREITLLKLDSIHSFYLMAHEYYSFPSNRNIEEGYYYTHIVEHYVKDKLPQSIIFPYGNILYSICPNITEKKLTEFLYQLNIEFQQCSGKLLTGISLMSHTLGEIPALRRQTITLLSCLHAEDMPRPSFLFYKDFDAEPVNRITENTNYFQVLLNAMATYDQSCILDCYHSIRKTLRTDEDGYDSFLYQFMALFISFFHSENEDLTKTLKQITEQYKNQLLACDHLQQKEQIFSEWMIQTNQMILSEKNMHNNYLVKQIMDFINSNYEKPLSLHYLSDEFHRSIPYISKLLKQQTDRSFTEILTELRIEKAKNLLKTTSLHINEIGIRIGYPNTRYFSKIFKQKVGMTPNDYRKIIDKFY